MRLRRTNPTPSEPTPARRIEEMGVAPAGFDKTLPPNRVLMVLDGEMFSLSVEEAQELSEMLAEAVSEVRAGRWSPRS